MSTAAITHPVAPNPGNQGIGRGGIIIMAMPLLLIALCFANYFHLITIPPGPRVIIIFVLLISMMTTGMPISIALGLTVLIFIFTMTEVPIDAVALKLFTGIEKFEIMAIPFFILAGNFLTHGGVARRMIDFATSLIGHWHGGLALAGIVACAMFALVCGSSVATVVAIGSILLPAMVKAGYPMRFGAGVITVAGSLGILMLPSIPKVIYAVSTNTSIGALFVAGLLPGTLLTLMLCTVTWFLARKHNYPRMPRASWADSARAFRDSIWGLLLVVIIIGGIYSGIFTATEAAAVSAVYAFFVATVVYRELKFRQLLAIFVTAAKITAVIMFLVAAAMVSAWLITVADLPNKVVGLLQPFMGNPTLLMIAIMVLCLLVGTAMDMTPTILILTPVLMPVIKQAGIDPVYFGVLFIINNSIGLITPPVGTVLNTVAGVGRMKMDDVTKGVIPFMLAEFAIMFLMVLFPSLVTVPAKWFGG